MIVHVQRKVQVKTKQEVAIYKPDREASPETNAAGTLVFDFYALELRENKLLLFKPPSPCYYVMVAQTD